jgi:hypothetical protein
MHAALFPYVWRYGEQCCGADGRPGESRSCWGVVVRPVLVQERLRGWRCSGWLTGRRSGLIRGCRWRGPVRGTVVAVGDVLSPRVPTASGCRHSAQRGAAVAGMVAQGWQRRGWPIPPAWCHGVTLRQHRKDIRGCRRPPSRARRVVRTGVGGTITELTPALPHSAAQRRGWVPPRELAEQHRGVIPRRVRVVVRVLRCRGIKCPYTGPERGQRTCGCPQARGPRPMGCLALERGGPRSRGRKGLERFGPRPRERLSLERGGPHSRGIRCVALAGCGGHHGRGCAVRVF